MRWYSMRCVYCGQCVESCPRNAIKQTDEFALANTKKEELVFEFKRPKKE
jgi:formate hydrogenlyase subunit 6/NADH:ubiquinone oxidoreductase subunit I